MSNRIIRLPEVKHKTGNSRSTIYDLMKDDLFPKPIKITNHAVGWVEEEVGFASLVIEVEENTYLNSFCFGFRTNDKKMNSVFLGYIFHSANYRKQVMLLAQGSTRYNISKSGFLKIKLSFPHLDEQRKIADFLSGLDAKITLISSELELAKQFKKGLLQQMFV